MTLIEGIGDEVVQFFLGLFFILVVVLAWYTTNITNDGTFRTVFLLERRRVGSVRRLITHTESSTIAEGASQENSDTNNTNTTMQEAKPTATSSNEENDGAIGEETRIVEAMDAPDNFEDDGLRRRINSNINSGETNDPCSNDGDVSINDTNKDAVGPLCSGSDLKPSSSKVVEESDDEKIIVKLKYVTDEQRQVDGSLKENIGNFKRRHFEAELSANKIVKLIFNGQVLQRDADTLRTCGLFDNCVVHCIVLSSQGTNPPPTWENRTSTSSGYDSGSNNQQNEWHLENYLLAILCCFLGAAWYLRYVYSQLYTVTATIGLILMTGIFTIIMFGMHFPDNIELNRPRTENVGTHQ